MISRIALVWAATVTGVPLMAEAQTSPDIEAYGVPADALVFKGTTRIAGITTRTYYIRNADGSRGDLRCIEEFQGDMRTPGEGKRLSQKLFEIDNTFDIMPERLHGVQREWYLNGQLKSESPYRMNRPDGLFREWDEQGRLIAQYQISNGKGVRRNYNSNGVLVREAVLDDGDENGPIYAYYPRTQRVFGQMKNGMYTGAIFVFTGNKLLEFKNRNGEGVPHGPQIQFDLRSPEQKANPELGGGFSYAGGETRWLVNGFKVSEDEYAKAAAAEKTLLPYFKDVERYREYVTPEIKALLKKYMEMPRVKIPLEFDARGEPVVAPPNTP